MIWNHDQDEPLMTRRKFFFLTGMAGAFAVAQQTGLVALVERPEVYRSAGAFVYGTEWPNFGRILKEVYEPFIVEQLNRDTVLLKLLGENHATPITAREYHVPLATVPNTD